MGSWVLGCASAFSLSAWYETCWALASGGSAAKADAFTPDTADAAFLAWKLQPSHKSEEQLFFPVLYNKWGWTVHMIAYSFRIYLVGLLWLSPPDTREDFTSILAAVQLLMHLWTLFSLQREQTLSPWLSVHADHHGCIVLQRKHSLPLGICSLAGSSWYLRVVSFYFVTCQIPPPVSTTVNGALVYPLASYIIAFIPLTFSDSSQATQVFITRCPFATKNVHSGHVPHGMGSALWLKACRVQGTCLARVHGKLAVCSLNDHAHMEWLTTVV